MLRWAQRRDRRWRRASPRAARQVHRRDPEAGELMAKLSRAGRPARSLGFQLAHPTSELGALRLALPESIAAGFSGYLMMRKLVLVGLPDLPFALGVATSVYFPGLSV